MLTNRSMPRSQVIPELAYPDVGEGAAWLCDVFGFSVRLRIGNHRAQLNVGDGAVVVTGLRGGAADGPPGRTHGHGVMVRVENVDAHHERARSRARGSSGLRRTIPTGNGNIRSRTSAATAGRSRSRLPMSIRRSGAGS